MNCSMCYNLLVLEIFSFCMLIITKNGFCEEKITITRRIGFKDDEFTIPDETCKKKKCGHFGAAGLACKCICSSSVGKPGFFYTNEKWQCITQKNIRKQQGCRFLVIPVENPNSELYSLQSGNILPLNLQYTSSRDGCKVDVSRSRYMSCQGAWIPLNQTEAKRFEIVKPDPSQNSSFHIKVTPHAGGFNLDGRLVRLAFSEECSTSVNSPNRCMLFKLQGTFTCPLDHSYNPTTQPVTITDPDDRKGQVISKDKDTEKKDTMKQSGNSTTGVTPNKVTKNNQDIVFIICGAVALVAVIFIVIIIINLRRTETRNRRRATAAMAATHTLPKSTTPHVFLVQQVDGAAAMNGGFVDDVSYITEVTTHSGSSGYSSGSNGTKKVTTIAKSNNYDELIEEDAEDAEDDPIYENICDKCKDLNLVGPCEHVEPCDSDDGPVYENLAKEEGESDEEEKKEGDLDKDEGEKNKNTSKEKEDKAVKDPDGPSEEIKEKDKQNVAELETKEPNKSKSPSVKTKSSSKRSKKRKKKRVSTKSEAKLKKQGSAEKPIKQDKCDLMGNIEREHSDDEDIGGEHVYDSVDGSDSDDSHVYESVCESSDDDDEREYYNIEEFEDQVEKVKSENSSELDDSYRTDPPPLPARPSDESAEDNQSSNESKENEVIAKPKKPARKLRRQTKKDESSDTEGEDCPRLPPRLYDPEEGNSLELSEEKETKPTALSETKEKDKSSDNENEVIPSLPPRLYDEEEEHVSNENNALSLNKKSNNSIESSVDNVDNRTEKVNSENSSVTKTTNESNTSL